MIYPSWVEGRRGRVKADIGQGSHQSVSPLRLLLQIQQCGHLTMGNKTTNTAAVCLLASMCTIGPLLGDSAYGATTPSRTVSSSINVIESSVCSGFFSPDYVSGHNKFGLTQEIGKVRIECMGVATAAVWFRHTGPSSRYDVQLNVGKSGRYPGDVDWPLLDSCYPYTLSLEDGNIVTPSSVSTTPTSNEDKVMVATTPSSQVSFSVWAGPAKHGEFSDCYIQPGIYVFPLYIGTYIP
ncbi:Uncharacterised protein [Serratia fonticola]|nr:Uncharacterised protein [Serratia fonticola]